MAKAQDRKKRTTKSSTKKPTKKLVKKLAPKKQAGKTRAKAKARQADLFAPSASASAPSKRTRKGANYTAKDIEVLEGLEPVRRRPGMYIGGTDNRAMHHLFAEVIDNAMDEAIAGHAQFIEVELQENGYLRVHDNGRGIPIEPHPKHKNKTALEVIMTMLHAGGKFGSAAYETAGGLHGVGISVVNALSDSLLVETVRAQTLYSQRFSRGKAVGKMKKHGKAGKQRGTTVSFHPDPDIFGKTAKFDPSRLYDMAKAKAYLFGGVEIRWLCAPSLIAPADKDKCPTKDKLHFPDGLQNYLAEQIGGGITVTAAPFCGKSQNGNGGVEWAVAWVGGANSHIASYCNTVPTAEGGTHEQGMRAALTKGLKAYGELTNNKKINLITTDDVLASATALVSVFIREPEFQGQTKDRLASPEAARITEQTMRDAFEIWLANDKHNATKLLDWVIDRAEERIRNKQARDVSRKSAVRKLRLPGKLADCSQNGAMGSELFIVEGDSAGGSAKQARNRANQAILPLRGKILNVANATDSKKQQSQLIGDLIQALGCGTGTAYNENALRYERVIIMTDADVDGAHIAALLITFFHEEMPDLIRNGHLYLAVPPLYRLAQGGKTLYARDDAHCETLLSEAFRPNAKVDISRFKGLGEMLPAQLKETTMKPENRTLLQIDIPDKEGKTTAQAVQKLMGNKPEARFQFIQENAAFTDAKMLDI